MKNRNLIIIAITALFLMIGHLWALAYGAEVTLTWDANTDTITGYRIYDRTGTSYDYDSPLWDGAETTVTVTVDGGVETAFVVRAYRTLELSGGELESADSNEVVYTPAGLAPESPQNVIIQKIVAAWKWIKNHFKRG